MSCSAQRPTLLRVGVVTNVSLSRPALASAPIDAPSCRPGCFAAGTLGAQASCMRAARSSSAATSMPVSAAGTRPKNERTE